MTKQELIAKLRGLLLEARELLSGFDFEQLTEKEIHHWDDCHRAATKAAEWAIMLERESA